MMQAPSRKFTPWSSRPMLLGVLALVIIAACGFIVARRLAAPAARIVVVAAGNFHQVAHKGQGRATIYELPGGKRLLALTEFATAASADLQVLLIKAADAFENESVERAAPVLLGELQTAAGDQTYVLPDAVDLTAYRAVTVWNRKYRVNFTTAPLAPQ